MQRDALTTSWGASFISAGTVRFRVRAPGQANMTLRLSGEDREMQPTENGWFEFVATGVSAGQEYQFILADGMPVPDPASRAQLAGVNGPSLVTSSSGYAWRNHHWKGPQAWPAITKAGNQARQIQWRDGFKTTDIDMPRHHIVVGQGVDFKLARHSQQL